MLRVANDEVKPDVDIASVVGLLLAMSLIVGSVMLGTSPLAAFIDLKSAMVVLGGALAAVLVSFPLRNLFELPAVLAKVVINERSDQQHLIDQIVDLAESARRDGLLALDEKISELEAPLLRLGVQLTIDGAQPEAIERTLETEMALVETRHADGKDMLEQLGRFAPAFGMIGTLMGLIMMLGQMQDTSQIGEGMAVALITTLYGAIVYNVVFLPAAKKLDMLHKHEMQSLDMILRGILGIQSGETPRGIRTDLTAFLLPKHRPQEEAA